MLIILVLIALTILFWIGWKANKARRQEPTSIPADVTGSVAATTTVTPVDISFSTTDPVPMDPVDTSASVSASMKLAHRITKQ